MKLSIGILLIFLFASSCTKVINLDLNSVAKKYVIEGNITDQPGTCSVKITQTKDFNENNDFPGVSGAVVTISDNGGAPVTLSEKSAGLYSTTDVNGTTGHTYTINVVIAGQTFTASSKMPVLVNFDSLYVENRTLAGGVRKVSSVVFQDPAGLGNGYHFIQYKNGVQTNTIFAQDDEFSDGRLVTAELLSFGGDSDDDDKKIKTGDLVTVVMECVDTPIYKYWHSLEAAGGESNSATPANPVTNITGGALGYFSAHTTQQKSVTAP